MLATLHLKRGDDHTIAWALSLSMAKLEEYAASELCWIATEKYAAESRRSMSEHLAEFRRCHEIRQQLYS
jgi:hypothetical protein